MPASCHSPSPLRNLARLAAAVVTGMLALLPACSRTGLESEGVDESDAAGAEAGQSDAIAEDIAPRADVTDDGSSSTDSSIDRPCIPTEEACNGADDDCNGEIDDGLVPMPCPGGGNRYCVAGRWSACPTRCEVCVPGSQRVCFISYCLYWGTQTCAADGKGFGPCREQRPPAECDTTARTHGASPELERCCLDHGYCCLDAYDLDADGNRGEILGSCGGVSCEP